jgi:hypothetical protein
MRMLKVSDLKKIVDEADPDMLVVISCDAEGNKYSPLLRAVKLKYVPNSRHEGDVLSEEQLAEWTKDSDEPDSEAVSALVLWPMV